MNVLSLFNGCGMLRPALDKAGIEVTNYYSSEIDKYASQIADKNYPDTVQIGDVNDWDIWDFLPEIDLLTAGFPCQAYSVAGNQKGFDDPRGELFFRVLEIREELKPKWWLFENVASMSKHYRDEITRLVGVNPVELNSKYWGAQNRARLFWTNIPGAKNIEMTQMQNDRKIYLKDILIDGVDGESKETPLCLGNKNPSGKGMNGNIFSSFAKCPTLTTNKGEGLKIAIPQDEYNALFISSDKQLQILKADTPSDEMQRVAEFDGGSQGYRVYGREGKSQTLAALGGGAGAGAKTGLIFACPEPQGFVVLGKHGVYSQEIGIRKLHPIECERLMNLPDGYTEGVSNSQRYKMLGNGWDVFVVAELLKGLVKPVTEIQPDLFAEVV